MNERMNKSLILVLGGVRSGKSAYADEWAAQNGHKVLYVATAQGGDDEMQARIERHRASRPADWHTLEASLNVADAIAQHQTGYDVILLDCLTVLTANILLEMPDDITQDDANAAALTEIEQLLKVYAANETTWLVVTNEVGMGIVPADADTRRYRDLLGRINQRWVDRSARALLIVAGRALPLTDPAAP